MALHMKKEEYEEIRQRLEVPAAEVCRVFSFVAEMLEAEASASEVNPEYFGLSLAASLVRRLDLEVFRDAFGDNEKSNA